MEAAFVTPEGALLETTISITPDGFFPQDENGILVGFAPPDILDGVEADIPWRFQGFLYE